MRAGACPIAGQRPARRARTPRGAGGGRRSVAGRLDDLGLVAVGTTPAEFAALIPREIARMQ
ncbi:hypothetical protein, partial [Paracraurococcus ruber]|uniref:hypothetical protein n=1 Tax=Paracraurococcus ruber TaxID=77675 RepID=UPI001A9127D1